MNYNVSKHCFLKIQFIALTISENKTIFHHTLAKVPLSLPAQKRECGIFGPGMGKNSIRTTGVKLASSHLVFATLASGSGLHEIWTVQVFSSLYASYTIESSFPSNYIHTGIYQFLQIICIKCTP